MTQAKSPAELGVDDTIRESIKGGRVGCGCLGALIVAVFAAYFTARMWFASPEFALIVTGLVGVGLFVASAMRGYHVLTGTATLCVLTIAAGLAPLLFRVLHPDVEMLFLPSLMRSWWLPIALTVSAGGLLAFLMLRMKDTISTPEALYAIQVSAAAKNVPASAHGEFVGAAFGLLETCGRAGAWPVDGNLISGDTDLAGRDPDAPLLRILVVHLRPQEEPAGSDWDWQKLGSPPWLQVPGQWVSAFPDLGPISVGELVVEPGALKYLPLRTGKPLVMPLDALDDVRLALNSFEIRTGGQRYAFAGMHIWRIVSLLSYLRGMHTRWDPAAGVVRGLAPREPTVDWPDAPTPAQLSDEMLSISSDSPWGRRLATLVRPLATGDRVERVLAGHLCRAAGLLGTDAAAALEAIDDAGGLLTALPIAVTGVDLHAASADLRGAAWVLEGSWDAVESMVADFEPWGEDESAVTALVDAVSTAREGGHPDLARLRGGFPDSALVAALAGLPDASTAPDTPPEAD